MMCLQPCDAIVTAAHDFMLGNPGRHCLCASPVILQHPSSEGAKLPLTSSPTLTSRSVYA